jgi:hypothetical protein
MFTLTSVQEDDYEMEHKPFAVYSDLHGEFKEEISFCIAALAAKGYLAKVHYALSGSVYVSGPDKIEFRFSTHAHNKREVPELISARVKYYRKVNARYSGATRVAPENVRKNRYSTSKASRKRFLNAVIATVDGLPSLSG